MKIFTCTNEKCFDHGYISIDVNATNLICGIRGVIRVYNAQFPEIGKVACERCGTIFYEEKNEY